MKNQRTRIPAGLVVLFHAVGAAGFLIPALWNIFTPLVPWHLLLMFSLVVYSQPERNKYFALLLSVVYTLGFFIEWLGVHTGAIFGHYQYGNTLGVKLDEIPLMIGVNWILVIYSAGTLVYAFRLKSRWLQVIAAATAACVLDFLIEPVAIRFDYWSWAGNSIPYSNYLAWFLFSCLLFLLFFKLPFKKENPVGIALFFSQLVFFLVLNRAGG